jgi:Putative Actinobacterial Holin-X, holin superfamily III
MQHVAPQHQVPRVEIPVAELVREAAGEAKQLIRLEVELAKEEIRRELSDARTGAITLVVSALVLVLGIALLLVAVALAIFPGPVPALLIGVGLLAVSGFCALMGVRLLPKKLLQATRQRLETDIEVVKEQIAKERTT